MITAASDVHWLSEMAPTWTSFYFFSSLLNGEIHQVSLNNNAPLNTVRWVFGFVCFFNAEMGPRVRKAHSLGGSSIQSYLWDYPPMPEYGRMIKIHKK